MQNIVELININYTSLFISIVTILIGIKTLTTLFEWFISKLGLETKWMRTKREDHELLLKTSESLVALHNKHENDAKQSDKHDEDIRNDLSNFMDEMRLSITQTQNEIKQFYENRIHDREQSIKIQKELTDAIRTITDGEKNRDKQIEALMCGNKELLGSEIDKRYRQYIALDGIPETEIDEFTDIYTAYKKNNGNHNRDTKYDYVKNHLKVIPVETKLVKNNIIS